MAEQVLAQMAVELFLAGVILYNTRQLHEMKAEVKVLKSKCPVFN